VSVEFQLPMKKGVVFWPVGTGDSTTLVLRPAELVMQIDLHHLEKSDSDDEPEWPIVDHLVRLLPKRNGRPYLAVFALTHPDQDHIRGFAELLKKVDIGELWHTPKIFRDQHDQEGLCDDAKAFRKEADRRRKAILAAPQAIKSGDRLRIIGHDDILLEDRYKDLPAECKSRPAEVVSTVDGQDIRNDFHAFIHAPFSIDQAADRNNTSLALNVVLSEGPTVGQFFFFGDREYPTIKTIFEKTESTAGTARDNTPYLYWNAMLSAHHCSKAVMYWQDESDQAEVFKKEIMAFFEKYSRGSEGYIVASACSDFGDGEGKNPPHQKARTRYEAIVKPGRFVCTNEYPSIAKPWPVTFTVDKDGVRLEDLRQKTDGPKDLATAVAAARGGVQPPSVQVGFGTRE
jgi:hypothetical protein